MDTVRFRVYHNGEPTDIDRTISRNEWLSLEVDEGPVICGFIIPPGRIVVGKHKRRMYPGDRVGRVDITTETQTDIDIRYYRGEINDLEAVIDFASGCVDAKEKQAAFREQIATCRAKLKELQEAVTE